MTGSTEPVFLQYKKLSDLLKVILYSSQSLLAAIPMVYHTNSNDRQILFIQTMGLGGNTIHYIIEKEKTESKFIELNRLTGDFKWIEKIGSDPRSIYVPVLELEKSSISFP